MPAGSRTSERAPVFRVWRWRVDPPPRAGAMFGGAPAKGPPSTPRPTPPGLALAVALPRARVDMIESASRKCAVIDRLTHAAGLDNEIVRALPMRAEERAAWGGRDTYDVVTARAVGPLPVLVEYAAPLLAE